MKTLLIIVMLCAPLVPAQAQDCAHADATHGEHALVLQDDSTKDCCNTDDEQGEKACDMQRSCTSLDSNQPVIPFRARTELNVARVIRPDGDSTRLSATHETPLLRPPIS